MYLLPLLLSAAASIGVVDADVANQRYLDCVSLIEADVKDGRLAAQQWASSGGGADAQHCLAIADITAGFPKLAAIRLEQIAQRKDAGDDYVRARLLAQAADAWLEAGEVAHAQNALNEAILLVPDSGELQLTAAKIFKAREEWHHVVSSISLAEQAGFVAAYSYVMRARAYTELGDYETAAQDVVNALSLDPVNVDALVLRGELQQTGIIIEVYYDTENKAE